MTQKTRPGHARPWGSIMSPAICFPAKVFTLPLRPVNIIASEAIVNKPQAELYSMNSVTPVYQADDRAIGNKPCTWTDLLVLAVIAALIRLPLLLLRGQPAGDEIRYLSACFKLFRVDQLEGYLHLVDYDKVFFILATSPFVNLIDLISGNLVLSAGLTAFAAGVFFVVFYAYVVGRWYGRRTGWWVGLLAASIPAMVADSVQLVSHTFYVYFFVFAVFMMWKYLRGASTAALVAASLAFASLAKIRFEGIGLFLLFLIVLWQVRRTEGESGAAALKNLWPAIGAGVLALLVYRGLSAWIYGSFTGGGLEQLFRNSLGLLSNKLRVLFEMTTPGGFLQQNKLEYLLSNPGLVFYSALAVGYDLLKTILILPGRLIPPLLFVFAGVAFAGKGDSYWEKGENRAVRAFCLLSLLTILAYPLMWFASSRFVILVVPVGILFIGLGLGKFELKMERRWSSRARLFSPRIVLSTALLVYMLFLDAQIVVPKIRAAGRGPVVSPAAQWIKTNYGRSDMPVMGRGDWLAGLGLDYVALPLKTEHHDGYWRAVPISIDETVEIMRGRGKALLVLARSMVIGQSGKGGESGEDHSSYYFSESAARNLPFTDESLENMEWYRTQPKAFLFQQFRPLIEGRLEVPGLELVKKIPVGERQDTVYVFQYLKPLSRANPDSTAGIGR